jgi:glutaconate CoA-transferase subunit A
MSRAARKTIITTERIVGTYRMRENSKLTEVPYFTVEAVVELPGGARPGICYPEYLTVDWDDHKSYVGSVKAGEVPSFAEKMLKGRV